MGSKRTYTVKEILKLRRRESDSEGAIALGGSTILQTEPHALEGPEHTGKSGALLVRNVISPAQLVANTDDWSPTDLATADVIRASTDASRNLTGIAAPTSGYQALVLANIGAFDLVLKHNATSTAANRFYCPNDADMTLQKDSTAILTYDLASTRWRVIGGGGGGGAGVTFGTPAVVLGTAAAAGSIDEAIRRDSTIVAFDATAPVTQAMGDAAAVGAAAVAARRDHKHGMPALGTTAQAVGTSAGGSAATPSKSDHVHATGAGTPSTQAFGDAAATGSGPAASMTDHKHAMPANPTVGLAGALEITIDGLGSVLTTGVKRFIRIPFGLTITGWDIVADASGSVVVDVWKDTYTNFPPTVADTIAGSEKPTLSSAQKNQDHTLTTWASSGACAADDWLGINIDSATTVKRITLSINYIRT